MATSIPCEGKIGEIAMPDGSAVSYDGLPETNYKLIFPKLPMMVMFMQGVDLPGISVNQATRTTPYVDTNEIGEKINYTPFTVEALVDSKMKNYREVYDWMKRMTVKGSIVGETDNPILVIGGVNMIRFVDAWPMAISGVSFTSTNTDVVYARTTVTFNYDFYEFIS